MTGDLLTADGVPAYLAGTPELAALVGPPVSVREVGDGNLNLVFVVRDAEDRSLVLKQSLPHVRVDPSWPMTRARTLREARVLAVHGRLDPGHVPALLHVDVARHVLAVEDLSDHAVWRTVLNAGQEVPGVAAELGRYVARVAFGTSVLGLTGPEHKAAVAAAVNPELSEITEDLVFTEPFVRHPHNSVLVANEPDVAELAGDADVVREIGLAKLAFMTRAEALVHGDLHTGSVFVRAGPPLSVRAFDAEFGAYGPVGFDLGMLWANLVLAAARATALGEGGRAGRLLDEGVALLDAFEAELRRLWPGRVDARVLPDPVLERLLPLARSDAAVVAAAEVTRRIVGFAKVSDVESLPEPERVRAVRGALRAARLLALRGPDPDPRRLTERTADALAAAAP